MRIIKDKLRVVASLTIEEIERIKAQYPSKRRNPYFKHSYYQRKTHFFAVWLLPMKGYVYSHFNAMLSFNPANPPIEALEIFNMIAPKHWKVSRLDIACDFPTPYTDCFLLPPLTNIKINRYKTTLYYGAVRLSCTVCQYNKQKQLKEVHGIESIPMTRIEFRFKPKLMPITEYGRQDFINMKDYHFVSDTRKFTRLHCLLKSITKGNREWRKLERKEKVRIAAAKERTIHMLDLFLEYIEGDIDGFMLDDLTIPVLSHKPFYQEVG